eukprot:6994281-Alexandrium_andersonii.AAC.1
MRRTRGVSRGASCASQCSKGGPPTFADCEPRIVDFEPRTGPFGPLGALGPLPLQAGFCGPSSC